MKKMLSEAAKREEKAITKANIQWRKRCVAEARIKASQEALHAMELREAQRQDEAYTQYTKALGLMEEAKQACAAHPSSGLTALKTALPLRC